jgi:hypothetical protein
VYDSLEMLGFKKVQLPESKFEKINEVFCARKHDYASYAACIPTYRDILIFKKRNKTVATARICFECGLHDIRGTSQNTEEFGQSGDYDKLEEVLRN